MNWKVLAAGLAVSLPLVALLSAGFGRDPKLRSNALEGRDAPSFSLESLDGAAFSLDEARGAPVVVNFWSTWCQPCKIEHPILLNAAQNYSPMGVRFVAVLYQDDAATARTYLQRYGTAWPTLADPGGRTAIAYGVAGVPETFFINAEGVIVRKVAGPVSQAMMMQAMQEIM